MKSLAVRSLDTVLLSMIVVLGAAIICWLAFMPRMASAAVVNLTTVTATSSIVYTNPFATTTRAAVGDSVRFQLTLSGTPSATTTPVINIQGMGTTSMTGGATSWWYATTTSSAWSSGTVAFLMGFGGSLGESTTTISQANLTGANVTLDKTAPTLNSVSWSDVDGSTQFSATDTLALTFSETMATTTITTGNVDTTLSLSGSHTFGTSPTVSWNTAGTVLTLTLGTSPTLATADTIDPTSAVKDAVGIADATAAALTITDNVAPLAPGGIADTTFDGGIGVSIVSTGSSFIRYTIDGTTPTCSTGTLYVPSITVADSFTLKAIGCDEAGNASSVTSAVYTHTGNGGGSTRRTSSSSSVSTSTTDGCAGGNLFNAMTGKACATTSGNTVTGTVVLTYGTDLHMGSQGSAVKALQVFLNTHGYVIASTGPGSPGNETMTFGSLTRAALIKYQKAKGITPAAGYFGPKTRAAVSAE